MKKVRNDIKTRFKKGEDSRRNCKGRVGTGKVDRLKKLAAEQEEEIKKLTVPQLTEKIILKFSTQAVLGDIESAKFLSKLVPLHTDTSKNNLAKIAEKDLTRQGTALLKSAAAKEITQDESSHYSTLLKSALENDVVAQLVEQVREIKEGLKK